MITVYKQDEIPSHLNKIAKKAYEEDMPDCLAQFLSFASKQTCAQQFPSLLPQGRGNFLGCRLQRIKDCLHSTMGDARLRDLAVMSMAADVMKALSVQQIIEEFMVMQKQK